jgi:hypothetical protein
LNPLKNFLFGGNDVTLGSVGGILGGLFGGGTGNAGLPAGEVGLTSTASGVSVLEGLGLVTSLSGSSASSLASANNASTSSSGGLGGLLQAGGVVSTLAKGVDYLSGGHLVSDLTTGFKEAIGFGSGQTLGSYVSSLIGEEVSGVAAGSTGSLGGAAFSATEGAGGASFAAGEAGVAAAGEAGVGVIGSAVSTIAQALPYIGVAVSIISDLASGNFRGAGFVAGGAAVGAAIGTVIPVIGTAVGAAVGAVVGGLADTFFPAHPLHPFDATAVDVQDGQLAVGKSVHQAIANNSLTEAQNFITGVNTFMSKAGLILENGNGQLGAIGQGIAGMVGLVTDPNKLLAELRFENDPNDTSQFGVAKNALRGMSFPNAQALSDELAKIAGFADATAALGIKLASVGQNITNIQVASVVGGDASRTGVSANGVTYHNDLRTALNAALPSQTLADQGALDKAIQDVNQFVNGTLPGLLNPIEQTTSSIVEQANKTMFAYQTAINQSLQYGLDNTKVLQDAEEQALAIVRRAGIEQINATNTMLADRLAVAQGGGQDALNKQAMDQFDVQAQQQREALTKLWTDTYGDSIKSNEFYLYQMRELEQTLGAERVSLVQQQAEQMKAASEQAAAAAKQAADAVKQAAVAFAQQFEALSNTVQSYAIRIENATGQTHLGQLTELDAKAAQEREAFIKSFTDLFGDAITADATFQAQLATVDAAHYAERLQLLQSFQTEADQKFSNLQDVVSGIQARDAAARGDQKTADLINYDTKAKQEIASFQQSFVDLYGPAITANENYQAQLAGLERVQGEERLAIVQKYGDAVTSATADQIKAAQGSVASLFTSLSDYVTKLQSGTNSPLSPTAQYGLAKGQFNAVAGAAAAGDATSAGKLTGFADSFLSASRAVYGSGASYATDFNRVLDAIQSVVQAPTDALTNSFLALQLQAQTTSITQAQQATTDAINALRREIMQQSRLMATQQQQAA